MIPMKCLTLATFVSTLFFTFACAAAEPSDAHYRIDQPIVTFDLWKYFEKENITDVREQANIVYLVTSLQGVVNREKPRLFLYASLALFDEESRWRYLPPDPKRSARELDQFWFKQFLAKGYFSDSQVVKLDSLKDLIAYFRSDVKGWSLWTFGVPATVNAAMMAAGVDQLLPVSSDFDGGKLYQLLQTDFPDIKVGLDLTQAFSGKGLVSIGAITFPSTGSAKNDVYQYAIRAYQSPGKLDPKFMWYDLDASAWGPLRKFYGGAMYKKYGDRNEIQQDGLYNADYWVSKRAFIFDLSPWADETPQDEPGQPLGSDYNTWHDFLEPSYHQRHGEFGVCGGFSPWWIKYTSLKYTNIGGKKLPVLSEWRFVQLLTSYNVLTDSDAAFGISNASFYQYLPKLSPEECEVTFPPPQKFEDGTSYICVFMTDYDSSAWVNQMALSIYDDPARGRYPLNWTINPILQERVPQAFRYLYENRTKQDFFGIEDDGAGYLWPPMLIADQRIGRIHDDGIKPYEQFAGEVHKRFGTQYTAFYICQTLEEQWLQMAAELSPKGFGIGGQEGKIDQFKGTPIIHLRDYHISAYPRFHDEMDAIFAKASTANSPTLFQACRCIVVTPSQVAQVFDGLKKKYPDAKVKIVDAATFFDLKSQYLKEKAQNSK